MKNAALAYSLNLIYSLLFYANFLEPEQTSLRAHKPWITFKAWMPFNCIASKRVEKEYSFLQYVKFFSVEYMVTHSNREKTSSHETWLNNLPFRSTFGMSKSFTQTSTLLDNTWTESDSNPLSPGTLKALQLVSGIHFFTCFYFYCCE